MTTAHDTPESVAARLRALDDETMCFDGPGTYALVGQAAAMLDDLSARESDVTKMAWDAGYAQARDEADERDRAQAAEIARLSAGGVAWAATFRRIEEEAAQDAAELIKLRAALAASEAREKAMREALEKAQPIADAFRASGVDLLASDYDICRLVCPHITVAQMQAFCAALSTDATGQEVGNG